MNDAQVRSKLGARAVSDLWRRTLSQIPTIFGRLVYLSSLRNIDTGAYEHHGLALTFGEDEANYAMRRSHEDAFAEWLNSGLAQQKADLDLYLAALTPNRCPVIENWLRLAPYRNLAPATVRDSERQLFSMDFQSLLEALRREYSLEHPDPEA